jgi:transcriptional regulator with XRE-family HTH domain
VTAEQLRAARALIRMEQAELAERAGVSLASVKRFEAMDGLIQGRTATVDRLRITLEAAGVEFTNGGQPGVRLRANEIYAARKNGDGAWGFLASWNAGDPAQWVSVETARLAAVRAEERGDFRLTSLLRKAADDAVRYATADAQQ